MSKYTLYSRRPPMQKPPWKVHPVWRGIGCLMLLIIPVMSYAGAVLLVQANIEQRWVTVPFEFMMGFSIPYVGMVEHFIAVLIVTLVLMFVGFGALMVIYALMSRMAGWSDMGPLDAPPERATRRRSRSR
jgi:hypothetical protein